LVDRCSARDASGNDVAELAGKVFGLVRLRLIARAASPSAKAVATASTGTRAQPGAESRRHAVLGIAGFRSERDAKGRRLA
jgi:hypothetical protein